MNSLSKRKGFSLFELLAVIAIIGLIGGLVVINSKSILGGIGERPVEEIFKLTLREARYLAASNKETTTIRFSHERGQFEVLGENGGLLYSRESGYGEDSSELKVVFYRRLSSTGLNPDRGQDMEETPQVYFRPDRSSTPFEIEFDLPFNTLRQRYDPFSDIVIESKS